MMLLLNKAFSELGKLKVQSAVQLSQALSSQGGDRKAKEKATRKPVFKKVTEREKYSGHGEIVSSLSTLNEITWLLRRSKDTVRWFQKDEQSCLLRLSVVKRHFMKSTALVH